MLLLLLFFLFYFLCFVQVFGQFVEVFKSENDSWVSNFLLWISWRQNFCKFNLNKSSKSLETKKFNLASTAYALALVIIYHVLGLLSFFLTLSKHIDQLIHFISLVVLFLFLVSVSRWASFSFLCHFSSSKW